MTSNPAATASAGNPTTGHGSSVSDDLTNNRTLTIILASVLSSVGVLAIAAAVLCCRRYRRGRRVPFFNRGITPIDDEEIETWKISAEERANIDVMDEKRPSIFSKEAGLDAGLTPLPAAFTASGASAMAAAMAAAPSPARTATSSRRGSQSSTKRPPAVIVYQDPNPLPRRSEDFSPRSFASSAGLAGGAGRYGRMSMDQDVQLPQTPVQARAPNARAGLTDEAIPGDEPFIPAPKRQPSRISKMPRARGSRGSMRSLQGTPYGSQHDLHNTAARASSDYPRTSNVSSAYGGGGYSTTTSQQGSPSHSKTKHSRVYSTSSIPPRLSFTEDYNSPRRPSLRDDIGLAIG